MCATSLASLYRTGGTPAFTLVVLAQLFFSNEISLVEVDVTTNERHLACDVVDTIHLRACTVSKEDARIGLAD